MDLCQTQLDAQREERNSLISSEECYAMESGTYMLLRTWLVVFRSSRICCKAGESKDRYKLQTPLLLPCIRHAENAADEECYRQERSWGALTSCGTRASGISLGENDKQSSGQKLCSKSWRSKLHRSRLVPPLPEGYLLFHIPEYYMLRISSESSY